LKISNDSPQQMLRAVIFFALWGQLTRFGQAIARLLFSISDAHRVALEQIKGVRVCRDKTGFG